MINRYSPAGISGRGTTGAIWEELELMPGTKEPRVVKGKPLEPLWLEHVSGREQQREIPRFEAEPATIAPDERVFGLLTGFNQPPGRERPWTGSGQLTKRENRTPGEN
jgi:hypothetical protein